MLRLGLAEYLVYSGAGCFTLFGEEVDHALGHAHRVHQVAQVQRMSAISHVHHFASRPDHDAAAHRLAISLGKHFYEMASFLVEYFLQILSKDPRNEQVVRQRRRLDQQSLCYLEQFKAPVAVVNLSGGNHLRQQLAVFRQI